MDDWEDEAQYTREVVCPPLLRAPHMSSTNYSTVCLHWVFSVYLSCEMYFSVEKKKQLEGVGFIVQKGGSGFVVGFETVIYHIKDPGCFSRNVFMTASMSFSKPEVCFCRYM